MYPVSANFHNLAIQDSPKTRIRIYFIGDGVDCTDDNDVQTNGTLLVGATGDTDSNGRIAQNGVVFNELFNPDKNITIGRAVSSQIGMTLLNTDGALNNFQYGRCKVYLDVYDAANSTWLACPMGVYIIELPTKRKVQLVNAVGFDQMVKLDTICDSWWNGLNWSAGLTLLQILESMASQIGVSVSSNTGESIVNDSLVFTSAPFDCVEVTYREVLETIAEATGTIARFDRDGSLDLTFFSRPIIGGQVITINTDTIGNQCLSIDVAEYDVAGIDALRAKVAEGDLGITVGSGSNEYVIQNNLFLNGTNTDIITSKLTPIYNRLYAFGMYVPISGRFIWDWSIEAGDIVNITSNANTYAIPIFQSTMTWHGGYVVTDLVCDGDAVRPVLDAGLRDYYRLDSDMRTLVIEAPRINLLGYTTINDGFKVNLDGTFEANGATINGSLRSVSAVQGNSAYIGNGVIQLFDEDDTLRATMAAEQGGGQIELIGDSSRQLIDSDSGFISYDENNIIRAHISTGGTESGELIVVRDSSDAKVFAVADSYVEVNQVLRNHNGPIEIQSGIKTTGNVKTGSLNVDYGATISGDETVGGDLTVNGTFDVTPRRCNASLSSAGWYRVLTYAGESEAGRRGSPSRIIRLHVTRLYANNNNELHEITLLQNYDSVSFADETSKSNVQLIDKIRATYSGNYLYVDLYYNGSSANSVYVDFDVYSNPSTKSLITSSGLTAVAASPSGETVMTEYTFVANNTGEKIEFTPTSGTAYANYGNCWYAKSGNVVQVHVGISGLTANTNTTIFTLPEGFRPKATAIATGKAGSNLTYAQLQVGYSTGAVQVISSGTYAMCDVIYIV